MDVATEELATSTPVDRGGLFVGVDGCKGGWLCYVIDLDNYETEFRIIPDFVEVILEYKCAEVVAVDIPIGLPPSGVRACDLEARKLLGKARGSSVFPAPIRPLLHATTYERACQKSLKVHGKRISIQAFGILPKIRQVDQVVSPGLQHWVYEVHPELSFRALNGGRAMKHGKLSLNGRRERLRLLSKLYPEIRLQLGELKRSQAGPDDLLDAAVAAWSATRIARKKAVHLPAEPELDPTGLRMEISY